MQPSMLDLFIGAVGDRDDAKSYDDHRASRELIDVDCW